MQPGNRFFFVAAVVCFAIALLVLLFIGKPKIEDAFVVGGLLALALGFALP